MKSDGPRSSKKIAAHATGAFIEGEEGVRLARARRVPSSYESAEFRGKRQALICRCVQPEEKQCPCKNARAPLGVFTRVNKESLYEKLGWRYFERAEMDDLSAMQTNLFDTAITPERALARRQYLLGD